jgi:hypothetical protein
MFISRAGEILEYFTIEKIPLIERSAFYKKEPGSLA